MDPDVELDSAKQIKRLIRKSQKGNNNSQQVYVTRVKQQDVAEAVIRPWDTEPKTDEELKEATPEGYILPHLPSTGIPKADRMLYGYKKDFASGLQHVDTRKNKGVRTDTDMRLSLKDPTHKPPNKSSYRMSPLEFELLHKVIKKYLDLGFIKPSNSPYGAPVLFAPSKTPGKMKFCIDYRQLNEACVFNAAQLP
jgi:hypothetical protein